MTEFFVAKRATKKMVDFYKRKTEERKRVEAQLLEEAERKEEEQNEELRQLADSKSISSPAP